MSNERSRVRRWLNRGTAVGLIAGLVLGFVLTTAHFQQRGLLGVHADQVKKEEKKPFDPQEQSKEAAKNGCLNVSRAIEAYTSNPANPNSDPPTQLQDLIQPPFGGPSLLRNGERDLQDPWGKEYQVDAQTRNDGTPYILVFTRAPDGTPISQHGIGRESRMEK